MTTTEILTSDIVYRDDLYPHFKPDNSITVCYKYAFPDIHPKSMGDSIAGHVRDGLFYPAGTVANHFFKLQRQHDIDYKNQQNQHVYFIRAVSGGPVKIGVSKSISDRLMELQTGNPYKLEVIHIIQNAGLKKEKELHAKLSEYRMFGEWFEFNDKIKEMISG